MAMESGNFSENADFLSASFPNSDDFSLSSEVSDLHTITFLERLEIEDFETAPSHPGTAPARRSEAWVLHRIEPVGPVDYLEYHSRMN